MSSRRLGYDATGNPGGVYNMSNPPVGKRFGSFVNGGKAIQWLEARPARQPYARSGSRPSSPPPATPVPSASNTGGNRTQNAAIDLLFQALDSDGDGVITKAELVAALSPRNSPRAGDPDSRPVSPLAQLPPTRAGQQPAHRSRPAYSSNSSSRRSSRPVSPAASGPYSTNSADREVDLYVAASMGGVDEVTRLIEGGADPNRPGLDGDTPLHAAAANGHGAVVAVLLQAGADTRSRVAGRKTALHVAAEHKHDTAVAALLTAGADPNAIDAAGETARDIAARKSHLVCVAIIDKHTGARQSRSSRGRVSRPTSRAVSPSESRTTSPGLSPRTLEQERVLMERDRLSRERDHANATLRAQNAEIAHMAEQVREGRTDGYISVQIGAPPAEQQARGTRTAPAMTGAAGAVQRTQQQKPRLVPAAPTVSDPEDPECSHPQFTRQQRPVDGMNVKLDLEGTRTHSMADQLDSKLVDMKIEPAIENHWEKEAEAIANMMDESTPKASTAAPKLKLNKEINLAKIVPRVVRLEQLGQHTSGCVDALRAEVADKQQTNAAMEVGPERDAQLKGLMHEIESFETTCSFIQTANTAKQCEPLVQARRKWCATLVPPIAEILELEQRRADALKERLDRLENKITAATAALAGDDDAAGGRDQYKHVTLDQAVEDYESFFNPDSQTGMTLGPSLVGMLSELTQLSASDGETFALLCKGEASDPAECRDRAAKRHYLITALLEMLHNSERKCYVFLRAVLAYFETEHASILKDAETAIALAALLAEKLDYLQQLPEFERQARALMKAARRDDKILTRTKARMRSCQNRIDEFDEFGNLADHSEDSDDEEVEDDDSDDEWLSDDHFGDWTMEQLQAKLLEFRELVERTVNSKKASIAKLLQIAEVLPELRFHPKLRGQ